MPDSPQQLYSNSAAIVSAIFSSSDKVLVPTNCDATGCWKYDADFNHPVYFASSTDPLVTVTCTAHCPSGTTAQMRVPIVAAPAGDNNLTYSSLDRHMAVIQPDGTEWDIYDAGRIWTPGASSETVVGMGKSSILGDGSTNAMTDGANLAAGIPRFDELANGLVPHALFASTACVTGSVLYPGKSQGTTCSSGTGPPMGARFQLTLTDAQINALSNAYPWEKTMLHAMHDYGVYVADTEGESSPGGGGATLVLRWESETQYYVYGQTYPIPSSVSSNIAHFESLIDWKNSFRIVAPCYALETCTQ